MPSMESDYRNGYIVKTVWHHDHCIESDEKDLIFAPVRIGNLNVYSVTWEDGSKHQRAYKNGMLAYKQEISKYGTVLIKETYSFSSNNKVKVTEENYKVVKKIVYVDMGGVLMDFHAGVEWVNRYLDKYYCKRLILSHHKNLLRGDYIIDDRGKHGTSGFKGEWICFGSNRFPDWRSVLDYLKVNNG